MPRAPRSSLPHSISIVHGLLGLLFFTPAPTLAGPPEVIFSQHSEGSDPIADCGTYQVIDDFVGDLTVTLFTDHNGESRLDIDFRGTDTVRNSTHGPTYQSPFHNKILVNLRTARGSTVGVNFSITVPGYGAVFMDVGRLVVDEERNILFRAGPHQAVDADTERLCRALQ